MERTTCIRVAIDSSRDHSVVLGEVGAPGHRDDSRHSIDGPPAQAPHQGRKRRGCNADIWSQDHAGRPEAFLLRPSATSASYEQEPEVIALILSPTGCALGVS